MGANVICHWDAVVALLALNQSTSLACGAWERSSVVKAVGIHLEEPGFDPLAVQGEKNSFFHSDSTLV